MAETQVTAGKLTKRVTLQSRTDGKDANGGVSYTWPDFVTVWACIEPARAYRTFGAAQEQENHDTLIQIRNIAGVRSTMRVKWTTPEGAVKYYEIVGVRQAYEDRKSWMYLQCIERQDDGWWK